MGSELKYYILCVGWHGRIFFLCCLNEACVWGWNYFLKMNLRKDIKLSIMNNFFHQAVAPF